MGGLTASGGGPRRDRGGVRRSAVLGEVTEGGGSGDFGGLAAGTGSEVAVFEPVGIASEELNSRKQRLSLDIGEAVARAAAPSARRGAATARSEPWFPAVGGAAASCIRANPDCPLGRKARARGATVGWEFA
jgi:hypothetical protein